jgi:uncharacterized membrane protein
MFWGFAHGAWFLLPIFLLGRLFWLVLLALLIVGLVRWLSRRRQMPAFTYGMPPAQPSALEILRPRYARGEIDACAGYLDHPFRK